MATEGRVLVPADVTGGNPVRTLLVSTQANDEAAASNKEQQVLSVGDPNTPANLLGVNSLGAANINVATSGGLVPQVAGTISAAVASATGTTSNTGQVVADVSLAGNVTFHLISAAFVGTVVFEATLDSTGSAITWDSVTSVPENGTTYASNTAALNITSQFVRMYTTGMFGPRYFRIRCSAYTSGTLTVVISQGPGWVETNPSLGPSNAVVGQVVVGGATTPALATVNTSGTANTNTVLLAADPNRKGMTIWNNGTGVLSLGFGVATTATLFNVRVNAGLGYEVPPQFAPFALNGQSTVATNPVNIGSVV